MLRFLFFLFAFAFSGALAFAQNKTTLAAMQIPAYATSSTNSIAEYINNISSNDLEKVSAIYSWVITNISYDADSTSIYNSRPQTDARITEAFRRRKGVCENFAAIFHDIVSKCGVQSFIINGYTKQNGDVDKTGHSWNAVLINNQWLLCDPTWDAGTNKPQHFLLSPDEMIVTHIPFDPLWQLSDNIVSHNEFKDGSKIAGSRHPFMFSDSVKAFLQMNELERLRSVAKRISGSGITNILIRNHLVETEMNIEIIEEERSAKLYNNCVEILNQVTKMFNGFVELRNKRFVPEVDVKNINRLFADMNTRLQSISKQLAELQQIHTRVVFDTGPLLSNVNKLSERIREQHEFWLSYITTNPDVRHLLFTSATQSKR
jgi:hypothetical protein